jgi:hypothetical protein
MKQACVVLYMQVRKALSGVSGASLGVDTKDNAGGLLSLIRATYALNNPNGLLGTDQKDVLTAMQQSLTQALTKLKINLSSAQSELDQLANNLVQLEANLFTNP